MYKRSFKRYLFEPCHLIGHQANPYMLMSSYEVGLDVQYIVLTVIYLHLYVGEQYSLWRWYFYAIESLIKDRHVNESLLTELK